MSSQYTVGVIGLGIMGGAFARNMLDAGFTVVGHDISEKNVQELVNHGGTAAQSGLQVAQQADVLLTSLPS